VRYVETLDAILEFVKVHQPLSHRTRGVTPVTTAVTAGRSKAAVEIE
jgi:hypothetical protein